MDGFKKFLLRGNVVDLAVAVVIGAAFGAIVTAFVTGIMNPLIGLPGKSNLDKLYWCMQGTCPVDPKTGAVGGHALLWGLFLSAVLNFALVAAVVYFFVVRPVQRLMDRLKPQPAPDTPTKDCPQCLSRIPAPATRCAFCTVEVAALPG